MDELERAAAELRDDPARVVARVARPLAPAVHRVVAAQNARLAASPARDAHLAALASGAAVVVTGQQVGLFLGPLYTLYKAASAVALARTLSARCGAPVVPVFWLQTEDHDVVEIASCGMPERPPICVPADPANQVSIAHLALPDEVAAAVAAVGEAVGAAGAHHTARLARHYRPGARWADAFAGVLGELFAADGLVVIDPRDPVLAAEVAPVHARALTAAPRLAEVLTTRCAALAAAGQQAPVHVRPGAPLAFFHPTGADGPRERIPARHDGRALLAALAADPLRFSTSALLRPLVQDALLPTAAYVGGPAEIAYFRQLVPLYHAFDRATPIAVARARFRIVDHRARRQLARLALTADDVAHPEAEVLARVAPPSPTGSAPAVAAQLFAPFEAAHAALVASAPPGDPGVTRALARTRASVEHAVTRCAAQLARAAAYADADRVTSVRRLQAWLAPGGAPQERVLGLAGFTARAPDLAIVERVLGALAAFEPRLAAPLTELP